MKKSDIQIGDEFFITKFGDYLFNPGEVVKVTNKYKSGLLILHPNLIEVQSKFNKISDLVTLDEIM